MKLKEWDISSPKERDLIYGKDAPDEMIVYAHIFKGMALTESLERCMECIPFELTEKQINLLEQIYKDQRNLALAELNSETFFSGNFVKEFRGQLKSSNPLPRLNLAGLSAQEKTDVVYGAYGDGLLSLEQALDYMRLVQFESMALKDCQTIVPVMLD